MRESRNMISVVIATHNGTPTLPLMLEALKRVELPAEGVEIIAVDNASDDGTGALLARHAEALPLTVLSEPRRGKSFALNRALAVARGDLVIFADDDILPEPQWLEAYRETAERYAETDLFAGQVRHFWQKEPPQWLRRLAQEGRSYAGTPIDLPAGPADVSVFKGLNFMARRRVLASVRFSERPGLNFGDSAGSAGGEDSAFVHDALTRGYRARYVPAACVKHIVRPYQVGLAPVLRRYLRIGRAMTLSNPEQFDPRRRLFGYPRYIFKAVPRDLLRSLRHWAGGDSYAAAGDLIGVAMTCGRAQQWRRARTGGGAAEKLSEERV